MGLFGKKAPKLCPLCGNEMTFFKSTSLADGSTICDDCAARVRDKFQIVSEQHYDFWSGRRRPDTVEDLLGSATLDEIRALLAVQAEQQAQTEAALGGAYGTALLVGSVMTIAPKATEVGLKRAKLMKNKPVVGGLVQSGSFQSGDAVTIVRGDVKRDATVIEALKNSGIDFATELAAHLSRKGVCAGEQAWLILDDPDVAVGDIIAK